MITALRFQIWIIFIQFYIIRTSDLLEDASRHSVNEVSSPPSSSPDDFQVMNDNHPRIKNLSTLATLLSHISSSQPPPAFEVGPNRKESFFDYPYRLLGHANKENESSPQIVASRAPSESDFPLHVKNDNRERKSKQRRPPFLGRPEFVEKQRQHSDEPPERRLLEDAIEFGLVTLKELLEVREPQLYGMGLYLERNEPASYVANFGAPNKKALELSRWGYAAIEASKKYAENFLHKFGRQSAQLNFEARLLQDECPLRGSPRCPPASRRYRTADGTCNNLGRPWRGSSLLPMQRFLPPVYEDGIQEVRRSVLNKDLPSPRDVSHVVHKEENIETQSVNLMFMQWGQLLDHDITSTVKSRSFNNSVPRCCERSGLGALPPSLQHPSCLPIAVSPSDPFLSSFGIRCMEFIRSAPSTRINCDLGWREQINQVTSYIDASTIYGSDLGTADSVRSFRDGKLLYAPPGGPPREVCRSGVLTADCLQGGDGRFTEQPGLTALHTVWLRYHNKLATILGQINGHWSDEKVYQETRRIVAALIQHITYREFLPIVLGKEVVELFELNLVRKGYYSSYDERVNPAVSNAFSTAAFRFGHSLVQNSFVRADIQHRFISNNVSLHEEPENVENIWSSGSIDRLLLGFSAQPSQRRDEFICEELTNHLFQSRDFPFGMDLAAINIQRGRDHGLPSYTSWREPCNLSPVTTWSHFDRIMDPKTVHRLKLLYGHVDDIDLFTGGLAEKPVRGGIVGPTFACIIAQQFLNLRKGDRFWYENGGFESSFTPAQLQQLRHVTFSHVLCQTLTEVETIQPFVFLVPDSFRNTRISCDSSLINNFDLSPWIEEHPNSINRRFDENSQRSLHTENIVTRQDRKSRRKTTRRPNRTKTNLKIQIHNVTTNSVKIKDNQGYGTYDNNRPYNDYVLSSSPQSPIEVNIKIQYYPPSTTNKPNQKKKRPIQNDQKRPNYYDIDSTYPTLTRPPQFGYLDDVTDRPSDIYSDDFSIYNKPVTTKRPYFIRPQSYYTDSYYTNKYENEPFSTSKRPYIYRPNSNHYIYADSVYNKRPTYQTSSTKFPSYLYDTNGPKTGQNNQEDLIDKYYTEVLDRLDYDTIPKRPSFGQTYQPNKKYTVGHVQRLPPTKINDKLNFDAESLNKKELNYVKISSVKGAEYIATDNANLELHMAQKDGDLTLDDGVELLDEARMVQYDFLPEYDSKWMIFNATEEIMTSVQLPDLDQNVTYATELPKPMKGVHAKNKNDRSRGV